ncbi:SDR family NAD(P)-dependent oxidoreductase [Streptomyces sp. NPDC001889]
MDIRSPPTNWPLSSGPSRRLGEEVASSFARESRNRRRRELRRLRRDADAGVVAGTVTGGLDRREDAPLPAGAGTPGVLARPRRCSVHEELYWHTDGFCHLLCPACASDNTARRGLSTDLTGRRVLLTGGRVKIGFRLALMMLRDGAETLVTSRFPQDTLARFRAVPGSERRLDRLTVVAVGLRDPRQVIGVCERLRAAGRPLDILVNNAAQTIRRPAASCARPAAGERGALPPGYTPMAAVGRADRALDPVLRESETAPELEPEPEPDEAALNMLTRTSAARLAVQGVCMCGVDTGWITDENPAPRRAWIAAAGTRAPLDVVDGAAPIHDPIVRGEAGSPVAGVVLKDYRETGW